MRILLAEDDPRIARDVGEALTTARYVVDRVGDGEAAWFRGDVEDYDAAVLDLGLPQLDGLTVLRRWRAAGRNFPVLILSARGSWSERVEGIDSGADDYLPKPFRMEELLARLRALLRRTTGLRSAVLEVGALRLDTRQQRLTVAGRAVALTPQEFRLLSYLLHHVERVVPATELIEHLYGHDSDRDSNAVEVLVGRLRRKLGDGVIETRRGFGYVIPNADEPP